jgi:YegS/Rv2252/BmrU family lipid kinase
MTKYKVIVNPAAGKGEAEKSIPKIKQKLDGLGLDYDLIQTDYPWHAADLTQQAIVAGFDVVVAVGGDGTSNEVLNGIMIAKGAKLGTAAMGVLPIGRGNDFAFGMGAPLEFDLACETLAGNQRKLIDVGFITGGLYPQGRYFGNGVGIGFDTIVGFVAAKMKLTGFSAYLVAVLKTMILYYNSPNVEIVLDGETITQKCIMVSLMNGRRMGGGFMMAPESKQDDGLLDLCIVSHINRLQILGLIPNFLKGTQANHAAVQFKQSQRVTVKALDGTLPVHADGETICTQGGEVSLTLFPKEIELITVV